MSQTHFAQETLAAEHTAADVELALIAAVAADRELYQKLRDRLLDGTFFHEGERWQALGEAIATGGPFSMPSAPAPDPQAAAGYLVELLHKRQVAGLIQRTAGELHQGEKPARDLALELEQAAGKIGNDAAELGAGAIQWAAELVPDVLLDAEKRREARDRTGRPVFGLSTGISSLDELLGGLEQGLYIVAAPPGMGKTTFAFRIACNITAEAPAVYVSYENSPVNLATKGLCAAARIPFRDLRRGYADLTQLRAGADAWSPIAERLALIEGTGKLTVAELEAQARAAMKHHGTDKVLVVVDYLQLMAQLTDGLSGIKTVRERVDALTGELAGLATRLRSPVLVVASLNRAGGNYSAGVGSTSLDSLKESGGLEYSADVAMFLTKPDDQRGAVDPVKALDLTIAKNRHGPCGQVKLVFNGNMGTIREADNHH